MMDIILSIIAIGAAITLLIGIHEFGHFWMARCLGIKVLRFSIGFGKALWRGHDRRGTEYVLALIPLGGYVKLLDEREGIVVPEELPLAFNRQSLWKRTVVVLAGPLFNIMLAVAVYWLAFVIGVTSVVPVVGEVVPHSIAAQAKMVAHQEVLAIDDQPTSNWQKVAMAIVKRLGDEGFLTLKARDLTTQSLHTYRLDLHQWTVNDLRPAPMESLGIIEYIPSQAPMIHRALLGKPAERAGLQAGDRIIKLNHQPVANWRFLIDYIRAHPGNTVLLEIERQGKRLPVSVSIGARGGWFSGKQSGYIGVEFLPIQWPATLLREERYTVLSALTAATSEVWSLTVLHVVILKKMLTGALSFKSLGGPLSLFRGAVVAAGFGIVPYLSFLGMISLGLAIINLLPIPGLDGGHMLYFLIEGILRRPISQAVQTLILRLGIILLVILMVQAIVNDLLRL